MELKFSGVIHNGKFGSSEDYEDSSHKETEIMEKHSD